MPVPGPAPRPGGCSGTGCGGAGSLPGRSRRPVVLSWPFSSGERCVLFLRCLCASASGRPSGRCGGDWERRHRGGCWCRQPARVPWLTFSRGHAFSTGGSGLGIVAQRKNSSFYPKEASDTFSSWGGGGEQAPSWAS